MPPPNVILIGFMGSGKSRVGAALAQRLGYELVDTDELVERAAGDTIARIFERDGEDAFRALEAEAVSKAASGSGRVIACGGGAILAIRNLRALQDAGTIVYLRASSGTLVERVGDARERPLLRGDPRRVVPSLLAEREPAYHSAADLVVDTDTRTPDEVADAIVERLA